MKEYTIKAGGRPFYGSELIDLQAQPLEAIQTYFKQYGTCILHGCAISANGGNWDIAAGLVAINHADGFKVSKFAGVTNVVLPGFLSITKTTTQALYESTTNEDIAYEYTASYTAGAPVAGNDTELIIVAPTTGNKPLTFADMFSRSSIEQVANVTNTTAVVSAKDVTLYLNHATSELYIKGTCTITNWSTLTGADTVIGIAGINDIPARARPAYKKYFHAYFEDATAPNALYIKDINNTDYLRDFICTLDNNGTFLLRFMKPSSSFAGTSINIVFDAVIHLK